MMDSLSENNIELVDTTAWPYLTKDLPGIGGVIKVCPEDFFVDEIPLYPPSGEGTHTFFRIEKTGLASSDAAERIADALGVRHLDIGMAGRKDTKAVTRQWMSVEHVEPQRLLALELPNIRILEVARHNNKLKTGHLAGNRFRIRVRQLEVPVQQAKEIAEQCLTVLARRGVPNYFGPQRFGSRFESHLLGWALVKDRLEEFTDILLGKPELDKQKDFIRARRFYEEGQYDKAYRNWPFRFRDQRRALQSLIDYPGDKRRAALAVSKPFRSLLVAAWQSHIFNQVLAARMPRIDQVLEGDLAMKHDNGACFTVEDPAAEQPRCERFEISPTGPLLGLRTTRISGAAGEIENAVLDQVPLQEEDLRRLKIAGAKGGRRALRFQPKQIEIETGQDDKGEYLQLSFELDSGCYATILLRELMKKDVA
ncbi:MAG: tRNA pseudouridine(13) synthase TruD [Anaerohalosphaeraceae bacterium]